MLYCTSILPVSNGEADGLEREFTILKGPDYAVTVIDDVNAFARQLGIDFVLSADRKRDFESQNGIHYLRQWCAAEACVTNEMLLKVLFADTVVYVHHGPVQYRNDNLIIEHKEDLPTLRTLEGYYTKRKEFAPLREQRFTVGVSGKLKWEAMILEGSEELLKLMVPLKVGTPVKSAHFLTQ